MKFVALAVLVIFLSLAYFHYREHPPAPTWEASYVSPLTLSPSELRSKYSGGLNPSYLAILGELYDVTGSEHYSQGNGYSVFVGQDATRAFLSGKFDEISCELTLGLNSNQYKSLVTWVEFYRTHAVYRFVGVVSGRFYGEDGRRTEEWRTVRERMLKAGRDEEQEELVREKYPLCNSKWVQEEGSTLWCDGKGKVPRKTTHVDGSARCACVDFKEAEAMTQVFEVYPKCEPKATSCKFEPVVGA